MEHVRCGKAKLGSSDFDEAQPLQCQGHDVSGALRREPLVAQADARARSEHMERIRRREEGARSHALASGSTHAFDPPMPWDYCFKAAAMDKKFWDAELVKQCLLHILHLRMATQLKDDGRGVHFEASGGGHLLGGGQKKRRLGGSAAPDPGAGRRAPPGTGKVRRARAASTGTGNRAEKGKAGAGEGSGRAPDGGLMANHSGEALRGKRNHSDGGCSEVCPDGKARQWLLRGLPVGEAALQHPVPAQVGGMDAALKGSGGRSSGPGRSAGFYFSRGKGARGGGRQRTAEWAE